MNAKILVFLAIVTLASDLKAEDLTCPQLSPMPSLDLKRYLGRWYEINRLPNYFSAFQSCITADYTAIDDQDVKVVNAGVYKIGGFKLPVSVTGKLVRPDPLKPSELEVSFFGKKVNEPNYIVLDTDYENYTLIYTCYIGKSDASAKDKTVYAWILSRQRTLNQATKERLQNTLKSLGVDLKNLVESDQTNC